MDRIVEFDLSYEYFMSHLTEIIPDGVIAIDLQILQRMNLLYEQVETEDISPLTRFFHVVESNEKITLFNDDFVIWIVPSITDNIPTTLVLIALDKKPKPKLETAFCISGIYNTSRLVLRVLEKLLHEIQETEECLSQFSE